jgi:hypothetical protein
MGAYEYIPPPGTPVLNAEPAYTSGTSNRVSWSAVSLATGYYLEWSESSSFTLVSGNSSWTTATAYLATSLLDGHIYFYRVKCRNVVLMESGWSNVVSSRQDASPPLAPGTPTDAGQYTSLTALRFDWTAATDGGSSGSGVASYDLQVGTSHGGNDVFNGNAGNALSKTVTGSNGQTLYARVRACDAVGNVGPWSGSSDGITIDTVRPRLIAVAAADFVTVQTTFDEPVINADKAANYTCTGGLSILAAFRLSETQYRLHTTDQRAGTSYTLSVTSAIKDRAGNPIDPAYCSRAFRSGTVLEAVSWQLYR